jgi:pimeloyl-ACP methyl ester carboxylesterase
MRGRRLVGPVSLVVSTLGLYFGGLVPMVAAQSRCQLTVEPKTAVAGTTFQVHGSGYTPTQLILQREGGQPVTIPLDLKGADPFDFPIGSRIGDEGTWHATAALPGTCSPSIVFTATLQPTDVASDVVATMTIQQDGHLPLGIYLLVIVVGFSGGTFVAWKLTLARQLR